jgi:hypothetical protein
MFLDALSEKFIEIPFKSCILIVNQGKITGITDIYTIFYGKRRRL